MNVKWKFAMRNAGLAMALHRTVEVALKNVEEAVKNFFQYWQMDGKNLSSPC